jgi:hypothetical protein
MIFTAARFGITLKSSISSINYNHYAGGIKSTICCAAEVVPSLTVGTALSGTLFPEFDSPALDCCQPKTRPSVFEPNLLDIREIWGGARDHLVQIC